MLRIGLTGGIACGKSHVRRRLAEHGLPGVDLDRVAHEVIAPGGPAHAEVVAAYGPGILAPDGSVDRDALGAIVFTDQAARARLNALVHPRVAEEEARHAEVVAGQGSPALVTDAALLVEAGVHLRFDRLIVVHCPPELQLRRLMERDGLTEDAARRRVAAQMPMLDKRAFAHFEIDTSGTLDDTDHQADAVAGELHALAGRPAPPPLAHERALACLANAPPEGARGLRPRRFLRELLVRGNVEMEWLGRLLVPPAERPWYRALGAASREPPPATLMGTLALWAAARRRDDDFLLAAAASVARLTHGPGALAAEACLAAVGHRHALLGHPLDQGEQHWPAWRKAAARWGGGAPRAETPTDCGPLGRIATAAGAPDAETQDLVEALARLHGGLL